MKIEVEDKPAAREVRVSAGGYVMSWCERDATSVSICGDVSFTRIRLDVLEALLATLKEKI